MLVIEADIHEYVGMSYVDKNILGPLVHMCVCVCVHVRLQAQVCTNRKKVKLKVISMYIRTCTILETLSPFQDCSVHWYKVKLNPLDNNSPPDKENNTYVDPCFQIIKTPHRHTVTLITIIIL